MRRIGLRNLYKAQMAYATFELRQEPSLKRFVLALLPVLAASAASAADLPSRYAPPVAYDPPPVFTWSGFYAGINGGFGFGSYTSGGSNYFGNASGGLVGGTVGYNYQSGHLVAGIEADLDYSTVGASGSPYGNVNSYASMDAMGTVRARFGYTFDRTLLYVTGGYAGASVRGTLYDNRFATRYNNSNSSYLNGFAIGAGVEYAITQNISVKGEYIFSSFGGNSFFQNTPDSLNSGLNVSTIRAGLAYHF